MCLQSNVCEQCLRHLSNVSAGAEATRAHRHTHRHMHRQAACTSPTMVSSSQRITLTTTDMACGAAAAAGTTATMHQLRTDITAMCRQGGTVRLGRRGEGAAGGVEGVSEGGSMLGGVEEGGRVVTSGVLGRVLRRLEVGCPVAPNKSGGG